MYHCYACASFLALIGFAVFGSVESQARPSRCQAELHFTAPEGWTGLPNAAVHYKERNHVYYQKRRLPDVEAIDPQWGHSYSNGSRMWTTPTAGTLKMGAAVPGGSVFEASGKLLGPTESIGSIYFDNGKIVVESSSDGETFGNALTVATVAGGRGPIRMTSINKEDVIMYVHAVDETELSLKVLRKVAAASGPLTFQPQGAVFFDIKPLISPIETILTFDFFLLEAETYVFIATFKASPNAPYSDSSMSVYWIGTISTANNDIVFSPHSASPVKLDAGPDAYGFLSYRERAGIIVNGVAPANTRLIGALGNIQYENKHLPCKSGGFTFPRNVKLVTDAGGAKYMATTPATLGLNCQSTLTLPEGGGGSLNLRACPVEQAFGQALYSFTGTLVTAGITEPREFLSITSDDKKNSVTFVYTPPTPSAVAGTISLVRKGAETVISYDVQSTFTASRIGRTADSQLEFQVVIDTNSVEAFFDEGLVAMTSLLFPATPFAHVGFSMGVHGGGVTPLQSLRYQKKDDVDDGTTTLVTIDTSGSLKPSLVASVGALAAAAIFTTFF